MKTVASNSAAWNQGTPSLRAAMVDLWRVLSKDMFNAYRPEKHYMRGPGPKWRERHTAGEQLDPQAIRLDQYYAAH